MGRAEDDARAKRAAERGREERAEQERMATERARVDRDREKEKEELLMASCSSLSGVRSDGFISMSFTLPLLALASFGWMMTEPSERGIATIGLGCSVLAIGLMVLLQLVVRSQMRAGWQ